MPEISVVICSRNGERGLPRLLESLDRQTLASDRFEVIVVDDGSTDGTAELAERFGARVVRLSPSQGLAAARNAGVSIARAPLLAFTDDDCEVTPQWLAGLVAAMSDPEVDGVGGEVVAGPGDELVLRFLAARNPIAPRPLAIVSSNHPVHRLRHYLRQAILGPPRLRAGDELHLAVGANMAMRRELVYLLGGFDEGARNCTEEQDLWWRGRARQNPGHVRYVPGATVIHHFDPGLRGSLRRARSYGHGHARFAAKHPEVRLIVYPAPVLVVLIGLLSLVLRRRSLRVGAFLVPLAAYPRWLPDALRTRSVRPLAYPFLELLLELRHLSAQLEWTSRNEYVPAPSAHLTPAAQDGRLVAAEP